VDIVRKDPEAVEQLVHNRERHEYGDGDGDGDGDGEICYESERIGCGARRSAYTCIPGLLCTACECKERPNWLTYPRVSAYILLVVHVHRPKRAGRRSSRDGTVRNARTSSDDTVQACLLAIDLFEYCSSEHSQNSHSAQSLHKTFITRRPRDAYACPFAWTLSAKPWVSALGCWRLQRPANRRYG
jgi:hypothetical protein